MSSSPSPGEVVVSATVIAGLLIWSLNPIPAIWQNKPVKIVCSGYPAYLIANALKIHVPNLGQQKVAVTAMIVAITLTLVVGAFMKPLVDVLNIAFGRNYKVGVRYLKGGPSWHDDGLEFYLEP